MEIRLFFGGVLDVSWHPNFVDSPSYARKAKNYSYICALKIIY